jgi:hypothetical protein
VVHQGLGQCVDPGGDRKRFAVVTGCGGTTKGPKTDQRNRADAKREVLSNQQRGLVQEEDSQNVELGAAVPKRGSASNPGLPRELGSRLGAPSRVVDVDVLEREARGSRQGVEDAFPGREHRPDVEDDRPPASEQRRGLLRNGAAIRGIA